LARAEAGTTSHAALRLRRGWFIAGIALVAAVIWLSLVPLPAPPIVHGDKVEHLATYGVLMLWFMQLGGPMRRQTVTALALVALGWVAAPPRTPNVLERLSRRIARDT